MRFLAGPALLLLAVGVFLANLSESRDAAILRTTLLSGVMVLAGVWGLVSGGTSRIVAGAMIVLTGSLAWSLGDSLEEDFDALADLLITVILVALGLIASASSLLRHGRTAA